MVACRAVMPGIRGSRQADWSKFPDTNCGSVLFRFAIGGTSCWDRDQGVLGRATESGAARIVLLSSS